jgi:hypothetical protein
MVVPMLLLGLFVFVGSAFMLIFFAVAICVAISNRLTVEQKEPHHASNLLSPMVKLEKVSKSRLIQAEGFVLIMFASKSVDVELYKTTKMFNG